MLKSEDVKETQLFVKKLKSQNLKEIELTAIKLKSLERLKRVAKVDVAIYGN